MERKIMKVNILETGSAGNCVLATFSDGRRIIFDFGTGAWKLCCEADVDFHEIDNVLVTHDHADHSADYGRIRFLAFPRLCKVLEFPVLHSVPNKGYIVLNEHTKEGFIYATDYHTLPEESLAKIKAMVGFKDWKWFCMLELSYCRWLYNKLDKFQLIGLNQHCSDERFFKYSHDILEVNPAVNILSLHASARQATYVEGGNKVGEVCPIDWVRDQMYQRFKGAHVHVGEAGRKLERTFYFMDINE